MHRLLTIPEVAELLAVRRSRAYQLARDGVIPSVRLGVQVRVDPARFEAWLRSGGSPRAKQGSR